MLLRVCSCRATSSTVLLPDGAQPDDDAVNSAQRGFSLIIGARSYSWHRKQRRYSEAHGVVKELVGGRRDDREQQHEEVQHAQHRVDELLPRRRNHRPQPARLSVKETWLTP